MPCSRSHAVAFFTTASGASLMPQMVLYTDAQKTVSGVWDISVSPYLIMYASIFSRSRLNSASFYELVIHLTDIREGPVIKPQNIFMPDMQIRNIVIHCVPFCCVFECHKKPPYSCDGHNNTEASLFFQMCNMVSYSSSSSSFGQDEIM